MVDSNSFDLVRRGPSSSTSDERAPTGSSCVDDCSCSPAAVAASADRTSDATRSPGTAARGPGKDRSTLEFQVEGLCCTECAVAVEKVLARREGVQQFRILTVAEKVQVDFDPDRVSAEQLASSITALGYKVRQTGEADAAQPTPAYRLKADTVRFAFVAVVALIALLEIGGEYLGWFEAAKERIPLPVLLGTIALGGYPIFRRAALGLLQKQINVDTMMSVGILGATALSQYVAAMLIVFFMNIAHYLEDFTTGRSRKAIQELIRLAPKAARIKLDGREIEMAVDALKPGDVVVIRPGEQIPVDGMVVTGRSSVNQASITGESVAVEKQVGDHVYAATLNELGYLEVRVTRVGPDTTFGKIVKLVEEAEAVKAPVQKFADRFTTWFLPTAIGIAVLTYVVSGEVLYAIAVLVAACPCAVGLATPLSVVASVGSGARHGLLIKGGLYLEALAKVDCVVMDKTGTVTLGRPQVVDVISMDRMAEDDLLRCAASVEKHSEHPIASAILEHARTKGIAIPDAENFEYLVGKGLRGRVAGKFVLLGNVLFLRESDVAITPIIEDRAQELEQSGKTVLLLAVDNRVAGAIAVADVIRDEVPEAIGALKRLGIKRLLLLTGDNPHVAAEIARSIGIAEFRAGLLPEDKIAIVRELQRSGHTVAMVGDGVNDAPALAQADVGIAMGVVGSDVALEAAHVALMRDDWRQIPQAIVAGRRTYRTIRQNIALGITWDVVTMGLASVGILTPVLAAATEVVPDVLIAFNSARLLNASHKTK